MVSLGMLSLEEDPDEVADDQAKAYGEEFGGDLGENEGQGDEGEDFVG